MIILFLQSLMFPIQGKVELFAVNRKLLDAEVLKYAPAFKDIPLEFTVHVTFVCAVFNPIASLLALAVVNPLWDAVIVEALPPKVIPLLFWNDIFPVLPNIDTRFWVWILWLNDAEAVIVPAFKPKLTLLP